MDTKQTKIWIPGYYAKVDSVIDYINIKSSENIKIPQDLIPEVRKYFIIYYGINEGFYISRVRKKTFLERLLNK